MAPVTPARRRTFRPTTGARGQRVQPVASPVLLQRAEERLAGRRELDTRRYGHPPPMPLPGRLWQLRRRPARPVHQMVKGPAGCTCYWAVVCDLPAGENVPLRWELEELIGPGSNPSHVVDSAMPVAMGQHGFEFLGQASALATGVPRWLNCARASVVRSPGGALAPGPPGRMCPLITE